MSRTSSDRMAGRRRHSLAGPTMGASFTAEFLASPAQDPDLIRAGLQAAADRVVAQMSNWDAGSDLNRLCKAPAGEWTDLPDDLLAVLEAGLTIGALSGGAFDIALGDLVAAWGFGPPARTPDPAQIRALTGQSRAPAAEVLEIDRRRGRARLNGPARIDLSGIAKGFGVDALARHLRASDIDDFLVGIDGELCASGRREDGRPWTVMIENPADDGATGLGMLDLVDRAVATSGSYRNLLRIGDLTVSHTMDGRSARPAQNTVLSVSVVAPSCMMADGWATALSALGPEAGPQCARARGLDALFVLAGPNGPGRIGTGFFA